MLQQSKLVENNMGMASDLLKSWYIHPQLTRCLASQYIISLKILVKTIETCEKQ